MTPKFEGLRYCLWPEAGLSFVARDRVFKFVVRPEHAVWRRDGFSWFPHREGSAMRPTGLPPDDERVLRLCRDGYDLQDDHRDAASAPKEKR